jgi:hypothetical protein
MGAGDAAGVVRFPGGVLLARNHVCRTFSKEIMVTLMPANDLAKLVNTLATGLTGDLGARKLVMSVIRNHIEAIDALVAEGYTGETIIDEVLKLTNASAPSVTRAALRQSIRRARKEPKQKRSTTSSRQAAEGRSSALSNTQNSNSATGDRPSQANPRFDRAELQKKIQKQAQRVDPWKKPAKKQS